MLMYWWYRQYPVTRAYQEAEVSKTTVIDVYQWLREICSYRLLYHEYLKLVSTGPGTTNIVEIDESCFSHKPKVNALIAHMYTFFFLK